MFTLLSTPFNLDSFIFISLRNVKPPPVQKTVVILSRTQDYFMRLRQVVLLDIPK